MSFGIFIFIFFSGINKVLMTNKKCNNTINIKKNISTLVAKLFPIALYCIHYILMRE